MSSADSQYAIVSPCELLSPALLRLIQLHQKLGLNKRHGHVLGLPGCFRLRCRSRWSLPPLRAGRLCSASARRTIVRYTQFGHMTDIRLRLVSQQTRPDFLSPNLPAAGNQLPATYLFVNPRLCLQLPSSSHYWTTVAFD
jgi:hypothetical protein